MTNSNIIPLLTKGRCQKQKVSKDCGLFSIPFATTLRTLKKQNDKSTQEIVEPPKFCMAILTICSNLINFGQYGTDLMQRRTRDPRTLMYK